MRLLFALLQADEQNASKCPCVYGKSSKLWQVRTKRHDGIPRVSTTWKSESLSWLLSLLLSFEWAESFARLRS